VQYRRGNVFKVQRVGAFRQVGRGMNDHRLAVVMLGNPGDGRDVPREGPRTTPSTAAQLS